MALFGIKANALFTMTLLRLGLVLFCQEATDLFSSLSVFSLFNHCASVIGRFSESLTILPRRGAYLVYSF